MTDTDIINSDSYWNTRFAENWEACEGPKQSRFFARIAVEHLPHWLIEQLRRQSLSLADWGCAQGDGTDVWASYIDAQQIVGVDFSSVAIEQAKQRYPAIRFINEDWLQKGGDQRETFDVVFSSNTLEHFHKPYDTLHAICRRAKRAIVLVLPYKEFERIDKHFFTFLPENIPLRLANGFKLVWSRVVDCRPLPETLWSGDQIILTYADPNWLDSLELRLSDCRIEQFDAATEIDRLNTILAERDERIASLTQSIAERDEQIASLTQSVAVRDEQIASLNQVVTERDAAITMINSIKRSASWRLTRPLRFAARLARYGLTNDDRLRITQSLRDRYHRLPLPEAAKSLVRFTYHQIFRKVVRLLRGWRMREAQFQAASIKSSSKQRDKPDYIIWGVIDWHFRHQRPQQLALALAATGRRIFYISSALVDDERAGFEVEALDASGQLFQIKLFAKGAPVIYSAAPDVEIVSQLRASIGEVLDWADCKQLVSMVQHPFWCDIASVLPNSRLVYDCMDHHEGFGNNTESVMQLEKKLLSEAELTITTSTWLDEVIAPHANRRALIRNAGEYEHFAKVPESIYRDPQGRRIIGYYGAIAEWFDLDLVEAVARQHPDCAVLLIGADTANARSRLEKLPNVIFTGEMPYSQLPHYLHGFDVCLLPFKVIPLTLATNPVKVYEYLGAGKPIVAVDLPEMAQFDGLVYAAAGKEAFLAAVTKVLSQPEPYSLVQQRKAFAKGQTWQHRAEALIQAAESSAHDPKVSIVVVTYNNLEFTRACLESLDEHSQYEHMEIIVVDNASSDGTPAFLSEWVGNGQNRKLILNEDNRGFAAANNQGLAVATGEYLVLLNNDTYVTPGWLRTLVRHLQRDRTIGLIGPVTNNIGNEAKIDIRYADMGEMLVKSAAFTRRHIGQTYPLRTAAFFCVMMPRTTYERVGTLDEAFGRGFFEDDDYCRRVEQQGMRIVCAEDVFIHHHLSASFNKLKQQDRQQLFEDNRKIYEAKWGEWIPHSYLDRSGR